MSKRVPLKNVDVDDSRRAMRVLKNFPGLWNKKEYNRVHCRQQLRKEAEKFVRELLRKEQEDGKCYWSDLKQRAGPRWWNMIEERIETIKKNLTKLVERKEKGELNPKLRFMVGAYSDWPSEELVWAANIVSANKFEDGRSLGEDLAVKVTPSTGIRIRKQPAQQISPQPQQKSPQPQQTSPQLQQTSRQPHQASHQTIRKQPAQQTSPQPQQKSRQPHQASHRTIRKQPAQQTSPQPQQKSPQPQQTSPQPQQTSPQPQQTSPQPQQTSRQPQQTSPQPQQTSHKPQQISRQPQQTYMMSIIRKQPAQQTSRRPQQTSRQPQQTSPQPHQTSRQPQRTSHWTLPCNSKRIKRKHEPVGSLPIDQELMDREADKTKMTNLLVDAALETNFNLVYQFIKRKTRSIEDSLV
ncbi:uncharacterized protein LOC134811137 isoform X2 [Bolinopsis microptera]|uniref:uncharacterized protein LOC134811137 isoform X2 n=1 Tax=Bolinopsis microptera TaxID=2820187 RepID=UPI00307A289F